MIYNALQMKKNIRVRQRKCFQKFKLCPPIYFQITLAILNIHFRENIITIILILLKQQFIHQKLLQQYFGMRGIQINNYFNNHITLSNKKINENLPINPQIKQKNNKQHPQQHEPKNQNIITDNILNKSPPPKNQPQPLKKRTNTLVELKKHIIQKRSISTQRHRNAASNKKKEDFIQQSSQKQQEPLVNMSSRKLNINKGGLGKRSKSTIIKTSNHAETISYMPKKQSKKVNSNQTNQSIKPAPQKSKRKKSSKGSQIVKQNKMQPSQSTLTSKFLKKQMTPYASKQSRKQKLTLKIDKILQKKAKGQKKTSRKVKQIPINSGKKSKPLSAREKKSKQSRFIEELKQKYQNQPIFNNELATKNQIKIQYETQNLDNEFLSVMTNLQKVLNSVGSKQKLKKQLEIINNKLNEFRLHSKSNYQEQCKDGSSKDELQPYQNQDNMKNIDKDDEFNDVQNNESNDQDDDQQQQQNEQEQAKDINSNDNYSRQRRNEHIQIINNEDIQQNENSSDEDDLYLKIHRQEQKNPLIHKKQNIFFIQDSKNQNSQNLQRKKEIQLLKKFKLQSAKMMEKVGISKIRDNTVQDNVNQNKNDKNKIEDKQIYINNPSIISNHSNSSNNSFKEDRYPLSSSLSPKFDQHQMINAISLKQQYLSSKHDKMSQLVKKMFQKQLVSPKSYEFQMRYLNKKYQEQNLVLESFKKQAEQLSSMLSQIKKDKEEIKDIDELIRNQKWDEAQKLVIKNQIKQESKLQKIIQDQDQDKWKMNKLQKEQISGWQREQGWQRVQIHRQDIQNNQFVDIGQMTNRRRSSALSRLDIDEQCGATEQSEEILPHEIRVQSDEECIYYNQENEQQHLNGNNSSGLIRLVEIPNDQGLQFNDIEHLAENINNKDKKQSQNNQINDNGLSANSSQFERKGFTTNLYFIKQYCIALCQFVRDNQTFKNQFKSNVSKPLEFNLEETFKDFRIEQNMYPYIKRHFSPSIPKIISNEFNNQYESLKFHSNSKNSEKYQFQKDLELDFVKMVCDALNQSLDYQRPGGIFGKALPWKQTSKHLKNNQHFKKGEDDNIEAYDLMFGVAIARIIQWGSCLCGFLPDTVQLENTQIDKNYVDHIRESRMAVLLQKIMSEEQLIMTNFQLQETQIYYNLAELIQKQLIEEFQSELISIFNN